MRSSPTDNKTLLRIQQEINEVAERENELRNTQVNGTSNGYRSPSPISLATSPPPVLIRAVSTSALNTSISPVTNGITTRRFIPNSNGTKGVMQKFFKARGKISTVSTLTNSVPKPSLIAWTPPENPTKSLIPADKPLRRGYVPVEERIQKELREMKNREDELKTIRRKSQPDLMAALEAEQQEEESISSCSRSSSPLVRLRPARSLTHLLDEEMPEDTVSAPPSLRPARSLAELCDAADEEIESPRSLIQQWETRIKESQEQTAV